MEDYFTIDALLGFASMTLDVLLLINVIINVIIAIIVTIIIISGGLFHSGFCWSKSSSSKGSTSPKTNVLLLIRSHSYWKWSICIYFPHRKDWLVLISGFYLGLVSAQNSHGFYMETVPDVLLIRSILMQLRWYCKKKLHDSVQLLVGIQFTNI